MGVQKKLKRRKGIKKVKVGVVKRKKTEKAAVPIQLTEDRKDFAKRLDIEPDW